MGDGAGGRVEGLAAEAEGADVDCPALDQREDQKAVVLLVAVGGHFQRRTGEGLDEGGDLVGVADGDNGTVAHALAQFGGELGEGAALDDDGFLLEGGSEGGGGLAGAEGFAHDDLADVGFGDGTAEGGGAFLAEVGDGIVVGAAGAFGMADEEEGGGAGDGRGLGEGGGSEEEKDAEAGEHLSTITGQPSIHGVW